MKTRLSASYKMKTCNGLASNSGRALTGEIFLYRSSETQTNSSHVPSLLPLTEGGGAIEHRGFVSAEDLPTTSP